MSVRHANDRPASGGIIPPPVDLRAHRLLGVPVTDASIAEAVALMTGWVAARTPTRAVFIVNAHTLNLACEDAEYQRVLNSADVVFGDGTGVRLAARRCGVKL